MYISTEFSERLLHLNLKKMFKENKISRQIRHKEKKDEHLFMPKEHSFDWMKKNLGEQDEQTYF